MGCTSSQDDVADSKSSNNRTASTPPDHRRQDRTNSEIEFEKKRHEEMFGNGGADALMVI